MRVFKTRLFQRWAHKEGLTDVGLRNAIDEMERGLIDAELGGYVFKKRVSAQGRGKSGGFRTVLAFRLGDKAFFMYGFAKNQRANINDDEVAALKKYAKELLSYSDQALTRACEAGALYEVENDG